MQDNIISEYKTQETFIDKYKFYQKNGGKIRHIEPSNPLMVNFINADNDLHELNKKNRKGQIGVIHGTMTNEGFRLQENKSNAINEINKYYTENGLSEPLPRDSFEHGQVIEFKVSQYSFETFESLKSNFLLKYNIIDNRSEYLDMVRKEIEIYLANIECYGIDLVELSNISISNNEFKFELFYDHFKEKRKEEYPFIHVSMYYKSLAKIIPYILFEHYLKGLKVSKSYQVEENIAEVKMPHTLKLIDIFEDTSKYVKIRDILVSKNYLEPITFIWKDTSNGHKALLINLVKTLHLKGYFQNNHSVTNDFCIDLVKNTYNIEVGISTAQKEKPTFDLPYSTTI